MKSTHLQQLSKVADALFAKEQSKLAKLASREAGLREQIRKLAEHDQEARKSLAQSGAVMRHLGADLLWRKWQEDMLRKLNIELAQVMAQKLALAEQVRTAFGRQQAVLQMVDDCKKQVADRNRKADEQRLARVELRSRR